MIKVLISNRLILISIAVLVIAGLMDLFFLNKSHIQVEKRIEKVLSHKLQQASDVLNELDAEFKSDDPPDFTAFLGKYSTLYSRENIALFSVQENSIRYWNTNSVPIEVNDIYDLQDSHLVKLGNGWYLVKIGDIHDGSLLKISGGVAGKDALPQLRDFSFALILIKQDHPYQNNYISNSYVAEFGIGNEVILVTDSIEGLIEINDPSGAALFYLDYKNDSEDSTTLYQLTQLLYLLFAAMMLVALLLLFFQRLIGFSKEVSAVCASVVIVIVRLLSVYFEFPDALYDLHFFNNPELYAYSYLFPSFGDLFLNAVILFGFTWCLSSAKRPGIVLPKINVVGRIILVFVLIALLFGFGNFIVYLFRGMILDSKMQLNLNDLHSLNAYSFAGFLVVGLVLFSFYFFSQFVIKTIQYLSNRFVIIIFLLTSLFYVGYCHATRLVDLVLVLWPVFVLGSILLSRWRFASKYLAAQNFILILAFTYFSGHTFIKYNGIKEKETRRVLATKLAVEDDPVAEFLYDKIVGEIKNDDDIKNFIGNEQERDNKIINHLHRNYFSGFWEKYDIHITSCSSSDSLLLQPGNKMADCFSFFAENVHENGTETFSKNLFRMNSADNDAMLYLGKIFFEDEENNQLVGLFIEFATKPLTEERGYPEILLDQSIFEKVNLSDYSYGLYREGKLSQATGKYNYEITGINLPVSTSKFTFFNKDGFNHMAYRFAGDGLIILSKQRLGLLDVVANFSYLFIFLIVLVFLYAVFTRYSFIRETFLLDFKRRIQLSLTMLLLVSLLAVGFITTYFIIIQHDSNNHNHINEKINSVLVEMEHKLSGEPVLAEELQDYIEYILIKFSNVFFSDINMYGMDGKLLASSRSEVFETGLIGSLMEPKAFEKMHEGTQSIYVHNELIGSLEYLSAYVPFRNKEGEVLAYLNLPYFAKQAELERDISGFVATLINVYALLMLITVIAGLLITNRITLPLQMLRNKLQMMQVGGSNEMIEWQGRDEIGSLITEYNKMTLKLSESAELLAKSERESAWKEMAKQVAHEIKNPLTPMKLSVQHLHRAWKDNAPDAGERLEKLTNTILEQIDTLSSIASSFSDFARMPAEKREKVVVRDVLANTINLYKGEDDLKLELNVQDGNDLLVHMDRQQVLRVFNNLVKNAVQSIPSGRQGEIQITLSAVNQNIQIVIADNGSGIPDDKKDRIFVPSFTTKTGGMGLGLAMVKNIIESAGGNIRFETVVDVGTRFIVTLPGYHA